MEQTERRARQDALKQQYRDAPDTALATLRANGVLGAGVTVHIETRDGLVVAGLHPAAGGDGLTTCAVDMLLHSLIGCTGVTLGAVAEAMGIAVTDTQITAEAELDFRGTLGVSKEVPVGLRQIRLRITFQSDASELQRRKLLELTERYCVVYQTIRNGVPIEILG